MAAHWTEVTFLQKETAEEKGNRKERWRKRKFIKELMVSWKENHWTRESVKDVT